MTALRSEAERLASALPPLLVAAERVASTVAQGVHGRRRVGQGEAFWQFRAYLPGDSLRRIDWRRSGRSDRLYIRETEWEAAQSVWLWCDHSPSMDYRSRRDLPTKAERGRLLTLALACLLIEGGERVALLPRHRRPGAGRATLDRLALTLSALEEAPEDETSTSSLPPPEPLPRHAELVLVGDFLSPLADVQTRIGALSSRGVRGHLMHVVDPAEATLPFAGRVRFEGSEGEAPTTLSRTEGVRDDYRGRFARHADGLAEIARLAGWSYARHRTDRSAAHGLLALYAALGGVAEAMPS